MSVTVEIPDDVAGRLAPLAAARGMSVAELANEVLGDFVPVSRRCEAQPRRLSFVGIGEGNFDRSDEELLADGFGTA